MSGCVTTVQMKVVPKLLRLLLLPFVALFRKEENCTFKGKRWKEKEKEDRKERKLGVGIEKEKK
jgi:hypothetical protein